MSVCEVEGRGHGVIEQMESNIALPDGGRGSGEEERKRMEGRRGKSGSEEGESIERRRRRLGIEGEKGKSVEYKMRVRELVEGGKGEL